MRSSPVMQEAVREDWNLSCKRYPGKQNPPLPLCNAKLPLVTIPEYIEQIRKNLAHGDATEHTHRPALKSLLESIGKNTVATNEPKRIACGAPDFIITRKNVPLGHVETKDVGISLEEMEKCKGPSGPQFKRYRDGLPNWMLTDYLEFHWYVAGERRLTASLGTYDAKKKKIQTRAEGEDELSKILDSFFKQPALTVESAKDLASRMAGMTGVVRDLIAATFKHGSSKDQKQLQSWYSAFKEVLIPDLDESDFSDMFAQTLAYGLFAARVHSLDSGKAFSRELAAYNLPRTNPFLRKLFAEIAGVDMPDTFGWAVDDLVLLLNHANWGKVLKDFGAGKAKHDPVIHFYETFLSAYDPEMREVRGVYYTPEPVVSYIVRSLDHLLQEHFDKPKGLADEKTLILDPAVGTATFLFSVVQQIYARFAHQKGAWDGYVSDHLLNRVFGFELLMAPYAVAHLKLGMELQQTGYTFGSDQRLGIYLTNTLEEAIKKGQKLFAEWISEEANAAAEIKRTRPILVILGNPPYSGHSANRSRDESGDLTFIGNLIEDYKKVDGKPLGEKNPKWLQDDYVKFIRFAQWRIERTGHGILGFVTNHSYLDNPTFRGMRQSLMQSFNEIHVYDLHGNTKKPEIAPDGSLDENVFDIQQGVAIILAVKTPNHKGQSEVYHADLWGEREHKYSTLLKKDVTDTKWTQLHPASPSYFFFPQETDLLPEYEQGWKLTEAMPLNVTGFQSHRDPFAIAFDRQTMVDRMKRLRDGNYSDADIREEYGIADNRDWKLDDARAEIKGNKNWESAIIRCAYRPFDWRWCHFSTVTMDYPRTELIDNMAGKENLALNVCRQTKVPKWQHALVSDTPAPAVYVELKDGSNVFPLYLCPDCKQHALHSAERQTNFSAKFLSDLQKRLGFAWKDSGTGDLKKTIGPEDVFAYAYAVLNAPSYQARYGEFLKRDFPRLPLTSDTKLFAGLAAKGQELITVHLMRSPKLDQFITEFPIKGSNIVEKVAYMPEHKRLWINGLQYFGEVPDTIWGAVIGGYQVCEKWFKDRKSRQLTFDDIQHWQRIVVAIKETMRLRKEIDDKIPDWPLP
jgi:hypothetical protein